MGEAGRPGSPDRTPSFVVTNSSDYRGLLRILSNRYEPVRQSGMLHARSLVLKGDAVPSPLGEKLRALRQQKKISLEQLATLTDSSKSYLWELENRDAPNPSADKLSRIAAILEVTPEFLLSDAATTPEQEVIDEAFFRKYKRLPEDTKKKLRQLLDVWDDDP